jgi:hypothetical protein
MANHSATEFMLRAVCALRKAQISSFCFFSEVQTPLLGHDSQEHEGKRPLGVEAIAFADCDCVRAIYDAVKARYSAALSSRFKVSARAAGLTRAFAIAARRRDSS